MTRGLSVKSAKAAEKRVSRELPTADVTKKLSTGEEGQHIYNEHKKLHSKARQDKLSVINNYSEHEQAIILRFSTMLLPVS